MVNGDIGGAEQHTAATISALVDERLGSIDFQDMSVRQPLAAHREQARMAVLTSYCQSEAFDRHGFVAFSPDSPFGGPMVCDRDRVFGCSWGPLELPFSWCATCPV